MNLILGKLNSILKYPLLPGYALLVAAYLQGVLTTSFYSDDFPALMQTKATSLSLVSDTRPIWGGGLFLFFSITKLTGLYTIPKIIGFLGLILLYRYTCNLFKENESRKTHYLIIAIGFLLPSFGIWSHWSIALFHSWGALMGLVAFEKFRNGSRIVSVTAMTVSCLIYPPATVFFFGVIFYRGIVFKQTNSELRTEFLSAIKLIVLAGAVSLFIAFSSMKALGLNPTSRVSIVNLSEFPNKLIRFFSHPFEIGFFPLSVHSPSLVQILSVGLPILLSIIFVSTEGIELSRPQFMFRFVLLFFFAILSISPLLLSKDNQIEFRLTPGISWAVFCTGVYGIHRLIETYLNGIYRFISGVLSLILIIFSFIGVTQRFQDFYFHQDKFSTEFIVESVRSCEQSGNLAGISIRDNKTAFPVLPYLGTFSMTSDMASNWVPINKTIFVLQRYFPNYSKIPVFLNSESSDTCNIYLEDFVRLIISSKRNSLL